MAPWQKVGTSDENQGLTTFPDYGLLHEMVSRRKEDYLRGNKPRLGWRGKYTMK